MEEKNANKDEFLPEHIAAGLLVSLQRCTLLCMPATVAKPDNVDTFSPPDRIIMTASSMFSERGYDATSIADIARGADVNKALIYYYFEDKQALYKEVIDSALRNLMKIWNIVEVIEGEPPERLAAYLHSVAGLMRKNTAIAPLIFSEIVKDGVMREYILANYFLPNAINLIALINEGAEQGHFKRLDNPVPVVPSIMAGLFIVSRIRDIGLIEKLPYHDNGSDFSGPYVDYVLKGLSV